MAAIFEGGKIFLKIAKSTLLIYPVYTLLIYKAIHLSQPPYLSALIRRSDLTRGNRLSISSSKPNKRSGLRSFIAEWNKLPQAIRTIESISGFRKQLKTYLFRLAYPPP